MPNDAASLKEFLGQVEHALDLTEPTALDDGSYVVGLASSQDGLVGLDVDTGQPVQVPWKYPTIDEKPTIINYGSKQLVIPPKPKPAAPAPAPAVTAAMAADLYAAVSPWLPEQLDASTRRIFIAGCLGNPKFYTTWRDRLAAKDHGLPSTPSEGTSKRTKTRQRKVDS